MAHIRLTDTARLVIEQDLDAENPTEWGSGITEDDETYKQWLNGDVYVISLERRVTWARLGSDGEPVYHAVGPLTIETWEYVEAIGGNYLDDTYTAPVVARDHFSLTEDETAALAKLIK